MRSLVVDVPELVSIPIRLAGRMPLVDVALNAVGLVHQVSILIRLVDRMQQTHLVVNEGVYLVSILIQLVGRMPCGFSPGYSRSFTSFNPRPVD